jgi:hypothetical protein
MITMAMVLKIENQSISSPHIENAEYMMMPDAAIRYISRVLLVPMWDLR